MDAPPAHAAPPRLAPPPAPLVSALLAAYVVLAGVPSMLPLGWLAPRAQAGDLVAVALAVTAAWHLLAGGGWPRAAATDRAVPLWVAAVTIACAAGVARGTLPGRAALGEWLGMASLVAVYSAVRLLVTPSRAVTVVRALAWMAAVASAFGLLGMALELAGTDTRLVLPGTTPYPYLGTAARAQGFTPSPAMLCSIAATGTLAWLALACRDGACWIRRSSWMVGVIAIGGLLLPVSKSAACLVAAAMASAASTRLIGARGWRIASAAAAILVTAAYLLLSHVTVTSPAAVDRLVAGRFIAGDALVTISVGGPTFGVYRTNYWFNKAASVAAIGEHWPWGLGPGGQNAFTAARMRDGRHPATMWAADPHSTYVGTAAELGLAGVVGLLAMAFALVADLRRLLWRAARDPRLVALGVTAAGYVALEAVTIDVMNFRHYWVAAGLLASAGAFAGRTWPSSVAGRR